MTFNEVDSLILCQLSYLNFKNLVPTLDDNDHYINFQDLINEDLLIIKLCEGTLDPKLNRRLLKLIRKNLNDVFIHVPCLNFYFSSDFIYITFTKISM